VHARGHQVVHHVVLGRHRGEHVRHEALLLLHRHLAIACGAWRKTRLSRRAGGAAAKARRGERTKVRGLRALVAGRVRGSGAAGRLAVMRLRRGAALRGGGGGEPLRRGAPGAAHHAAEHQQRPRTQRQAEQARAERSA
jgi:hypothetical protein